MSQRQGIVTFKGQGMTLVGDEVALGQPAPNATVTANDMSPVDLSSYKGKVVIVTVVPSLDTPVCDIQTKRFNKEAQGLGDDVTVLTISMDLPFAQARWCGAADAKNVITLSDFKDRSFGQSWGLLIKELGLLTRAVYVLDKQGIVRHAQIVPEITSEPDYDAVLKAARAAV